MSADEAQQNVPQVENGTIRSNYDETVDSFDALGLKDSLLRGVYGHGFEHPSTIQQRAILPIMKGHDVLAQSQSGTGKTATFTIGTLQRIDETKKTTQALILAPTRELALQIQSVVHNLGEFMNVTCHACIGGTSLEADMDALRSGAQVVVGTPGRVLDVIQRRILDTRDIKMFVLDEADEMLSRGFKEQIYHVYTVLPEEFQIVLMSATMPPEVLSVTKFFMKNPVTILVKKDELTLEGIKQFFIDVNEEQYKIVTLCDIYETITVSQAVIFCNTRQSCENVRDALEENNFVVSMIHGDMEQKERDIIMNEFRTGSSRILIATDLLARGIDVQQVSVVINFDLPKDLSSYLHRVGRGGRFGRRGVAINLVTEESKNQLRMIEQYYSTVIEEMPSDVAKYM